MKYFMLVLFLILFIPNMAAEEVFHHFNGKHGGLVQKTDHAVFELVQDHEHTSIYLTGHDQKMITNDKLSLSAIAKIGDKEYPMQLSFENDHYSPSPANSYMHKERNYVLILTLKLANSVDRAKFNIKGR